MSADYLSRAGFLEALGAPLCVFNFGINVLGFLTEITSLALFPVVFPLVVQAIWMASSFPRSIWRIVGEALEIGYPLVEVREAHLQRICVGNFS